MALEGYDLVMLGVLAAAALLGYFKGMIWQVAWIAGIVVSSFVALRFGGQLAPHFGNQAPWNRFAAMLACYVASSLAVWLVFRTISGAINAVHLSAFDHQLGFLLGLAKGVLLCVVITFFSVTLAPAYRHQIVASRSGRIVADLIVRADVYLPKQLHETVEPFVRQFEQQFAPQSGMQGFEPQPAVAYGAGHEPATSGQPSPLKALWDGLTNASAAAWAGGAEQGGAPGQPVAGSGVLPAGASWIVPGGGPAPRQAASSPMPTGAPGATWATQPIVSSQRFAPQPAIAAPSGQPFVNRAPAPFPPPAAGQRPAGFQQPVYPQPGFQQSGYQQPAGYPVGAQSPLPRR